MKMFVLAAVLAFTATVARAGETIKLPAPQKTGGPELFKAIDERRSPKQNSFPEKMPSDQELATILWAATGANRDGKLWTVPMAMGKPPYCQLYLVSEKGAYRYDWRQHALEVISTEDFTDVVPIQPFAKNAPLTIVVVADGKELAALNSPNALEFAAVLAGAMSQNIYLAAEAVGVGARVVYSIKRDECVKALRLDEKDKALFGIVMGKY